MSISRRKLLKNSAAVAAIGVASPHVWLPSTAYAANTLKKGDPIKVGLLFSLTGALATPEEDSTLVMQYAIDEINDAGGIDGHPIEPVIIDAKSDFKVYSAKTKELILKDKVISIFGCYTSASRKAVSPTVMKYDNLLFYPTCYEGAECTQNIVNTGPLANQHSFDLIPYMVDQFGPRTFFVGSNYVWPKESNKNAKVWLEQSNGELLGEEYIPLGSSEFGPVLEKIRATNPDFIFSTVVGASDISFHRQFKQAGFKVDKMPIASLTTGEIETAAMGVEYGAGHFLSAPYFQTMPGAVNERFVDGFLSSKYGKNGTTHYNMEETYLSAYVFKGAVEKAVAEFGMNDVTPERIRDMTAGLAVEDDVSPEGKIWIDPDNFNCWLKPKIGQCQGDGSFKIVKEAPEHVAPDPYSIYPDAGVCKSDGLHAPDGSVKVDVI
jgi:urea transport system substrate-binding protein